MSVAKVYSTIRRRLLRLQRAQFDLWTNYQRIDRAQVSEEYWRELQANAIAAQAGLDTPTFYSLFEGTYMPSYKRYIAQVSSDVAY